MRDNQTRTAAQIIRRRLDHIAAISFSEVKTEISKPRFPGKLILESTRTRAVFKCVDFVGFLFSSPSFSDR